MCAHMSGVVDLWAERDRLRVEVERLKESLGVRALADIHRAEFAEAERDKLRVEVDELKSVYSELVENTRAMRNEAYEQGCVEKAEMVAAIEQAVDDFGEGHSVCEYTKRRLIAVLARNAVPEGGGSGS